MRVVAIVQARMGSTRLPGKALAEIVGKPAIWHLFRQLGGAALLDEIVLATTIEKKDDALADYAASQSWQLYRGNEEDVLDRYYQTARAAGCTQCDAIVRVTGDDILVDPLVVDQVVQLFRDHQPEVKHVSNDRTPGYPYGAGVEVFSFCALEQAWRDSVLPSDREHVTPYIRNHPQAFPFAELRPPYEYSRIHLSIDTPEDLELNRRLFERLYTVSQPPFHLTEVIDCVVQLEVGLERGPS